jgi:hypothetical protein
MLPTIRKFDWGAKMKKRLTVGIGGILTALALIAVPGASAATEFGSNCTATAALPNGFIWQTGGAPTRPLPSAAPISGVITKWKIALTNEAMGITVPQQLKVVRPTGLPKQVQVIAESAFAGVVAGANAFETRLPVKAGDLLGLAGTTEIGGLYCESPFLEDRVGAATGNPPVGSTVTAAEEAGGLQLAAAAIIEPDADNDGFGDETQDKCPQSAATQAACPVAALSASATAKKGLVNVLVTSTVQAPVTVAGTVKLGGGKSAKPSGGTQTVAPGVLAKFTVPFPKKLKSKLKQLSRKHSLTLTLTITAPNVTGAVSTSTLKVKLKGQAKPKG